MAAQLLTDSKIKREIGKAKGGTTRLVLRDAKVRGLVLRITPKGTATWSLQYRPECSTIPYRLTLGMYPELSLRDARHKAEAQRGDIARGFDPIKVKCERAAQRVAYTRMTFGEVAQDYLRKRIPKEKNRRKLQVMFDGELLPALGDLALEEVRRENVMPICRHIDRRGAEAQARDVFSYARAVLNFAVERGMLAASPLMGVKFGKARKPRERYLSVEEVRAFWTNLDSAPMQDSHKAIMRLQLLLGRRVSEVSGLARHEINMDARLWTIPAERNKSGIELKVPLTKTARAIVEAWLSRTDGQLLFPNSRGNPYDAKHIANALLAAQRHFGFTTYTGEPNHFTTHDLRRTCGTYLRMLKIPDDVRAAVLGHTVKETVTNRYYNRADISAEVREALAVWQAALQLILRGGDPFAPSTRDADDVEERAERRYSATVGIGES